MLYNIPESWGVKRVPRTPPKQRKEVITLGIPYDDLFDFDTLFNDVINLGNGQTLLIGPPLYELKRQISFVQNGNPLEHRFFDRINCGLTIVNGVGDFTLVNPKGNIEIETEARSTQFADMGCMSTMQKNEPIQWIKDWVQYHHVAHGVRGFIIYDNNSDHYTVEELQAELDSLDYDIINLVLPWNVPFGPHTPTWDSNFSQFTQLEHWKYKYAWCSKFAINQDIDELLVLDGITLDQVLDEIHLKQIPGVMYLTRNIDPYNERLELSAHELPIEERRYKDYYYYSEYNNTNNVKVGRRLIHKWIAVPQYAMQYQWAVHDFGYEFDNDSAKVEPDSGIYFAHMYAMQSRHKDKHPEFHNRNKQRVALDEITLDEALKATLLKVFGE